MLRVYHRFIHHLSTPGKLLLTGIFLLGAFLGTRLMMASGSSLPFEDSLTSLFPGIDTGNYSEINFSYGGNNFAGLSFWLTGEQLATPEYLHNAAQTLACSTKLKGLYYNNMRGRRLRPLDTGSLAILSGQGAGSGYTTLQFTWGLYTNCVNSGGYASVHSNEIYGQIDHTRGGVSYHLFAGLLYDTGTNNIVAGSSFANTLTISNGSISGYLFDTYGGIALIGSGSIGYCGNGALEAGEQCDDGNANTSDGCSATCTIEPFDANFCTGAWQVSPLTGNTNSPITFSLLNHRGSGVSIMGFSGAFSSGWVSTGISHYTYAPGFASTGTYTWTIYFANNYSGSVTGQCSWQTYISGGVALCQWFAASTTNIQTGQNISFTCSGNNVTWYVLDIWSWAVGSTNLYTQTVYTSANNYTWATGAYLPLGDNYIATCSVLTGLGTGPQCDSQVAFTVTTGAICPAFTGAGTLQMSWALLISGIAYSAQSSFSAILSGLNTSTYYLSGGFVGSPLIGAYTGIALTKLITLSTPNILTPLYANVRSWACNYPFASTWVYRDTLAPSTPVITSPSNMSTLATTGIQLSWSASTDTGAGLSGYQYLLQNTNGAVFSGTLSAATLSTTLNACTLSGGSYNRVIKAIDRVGNISSSITQNFSLSGQSCLGYAGALSFSWLQDITDADTSTSYQSEIFYVLGSTGTLLSLSRGNLIKNGTDIGSTGLVSASDQLQIEMISSSHYDTEVVSTLSIGGLTGHFAITTYSESNCSLSSSQKLIVARIYDMLKGSYDNNPDKTDEFLNTFTSMLEDRVGTTDDCSTQYLLDLMQNDGSSGDTTDHTAPNGKSYSIDYDQAIEGYYSPEMKVRSYFINRESLIRHIDYYNPGNIHTPKYGSNTRSIERNTSTKHIAPNGKIYRISDNTNGYTSQDMSKPKYFASSEALITYLDKQNPAKIVWNHTVDTSFAPLTYLAANNKSYIIYKTDKGYMSYRLMKVRYFGSLAEIQSFINWNNPSS